MKLLKKLLPIASVASVAAIVTPIVTSCNGSNVIDGSKLFIPTVAQAVADADHKETGYKRGEAIQLYVKDVDDNTEVLVQDIKATVSQFAYYDIRAVQKGMPVPEWKIELNYSDISVSTIKGSETMSFEVKGSIKIKNSYFLEQNDATRGIDEIDLTNIDIKVTKVPYLANYIGSGQRSGWTIYSPSLDPAQTSEIFLPNEASVSLTTTGKIYGGRSRQWYSFDNETYTLDKDHSVFATQYTKWFIPFYLSFISTNVLMMSLPELYIFLGFSYHMANIPYSPE